MRNVLNPTVIKDVANSSMGYATHATMIDGGTLCLTCVNSNMTLLKEEYSDAENHGYVISQGQWLVAEVSANWEDSHLYCSNCSEDIAPLYQ